MTLILSDENVRQVAQIDAVVDELEHALAAEAVRGEAVLPDRLNLSLNSTLFRVMPAILPASGVLGLKLFYGTLEDGVRYSIIVSSLAGGEVLAVVDAAYLTALRTGATSGVATRHLARPRARTVGVIGSGLEAETNLAAVCAVRPIEHVCVYSPNSGRRAAFAARMTEELGIAVEAADTPEAAVDGVDIVVVATNTGRGGEPAYRGEWLQAGQHVVSIGSTAPFLRELDEQALLRPDVVVVDADPDQVAGESGDAIAVTAKHPGWRPSGTLDDLLAGTVRRSDHGEITLFKSVGTAAQDLIAALAVLRLAADRGIGLVVPDINKPKPF